jgi:hypothetical protein
LLPALLNGCVFRHKRQERFGQRTRIFRGVVAELGWDICCVAVPI